jgi:hypothetical protein
MLGKEGEGTSAKRLGKDGGRSGWKEEWGRQKQSTDDKILACDLQSLRGSHSLERRPMRTNWCTTVKWRDRSMWSSEFVTFALLEVISMRTNQCATLKWMQRSLEDANFAPIIITPLGWGLRGTRGMQGKIAWCNLSLSSSSGYLRFGVSIITR